MVENPSCCDRLPKSPRACIAPALFPSSPPPRRWSSGNRGIAVSGKRPYRRELHARGLRRVKQRQQRAAGLGKGSIRQELNRLDPLRLGLGRVAGGFARLGEE